MLDSVLLKEELFTQIFVSNSREIKQIILFFIDVRLYEMIYKNKSPNFQKKKDYSSLYIARDSIVKYTKNLWGHYLNFLLIVCYFSWGFNRINVDFK